MDYIRAAAETVFIDATFLVAIVLARRAQQVPRVQVPCKETS
jgi:hypothetical protein